VTVLVAPTVQRVAWPVVGGVVATFVVALALRLVGIADRAFWTDEGYSAWLSVQPVTVILRHDPFHPPLYPLLLKWWAGLHPLLDGDGGRRLLSAIASALTVVVCVGAVRATGLPGGGLTTALTTTSAIGVWYAQEQRSVALTALLLAVAAASLALLAYRGGCFGAASSCTGRRVPAPAGDAAVGTRGRSLILLWLVYGTAAVVGIWTHYAMIPLVAALGLVFLVMVRQQRWLVLGWLFVTTVVVLGSLPLVPRLAEAMGQVVGHRFAERAVLVFVPGVALLTVVGAGGWWLARRRPRWRQPVAGLAGVLVVLGFAAIMLTPAGNSLKRHLAIIAPLALTGAAVAVATWRPRLGPLLVAAGLPALVLVLFVHPKEDWHGVAALLKAEERPGDVLVLYQGYQAIVLARYYDGALPLIGFGEGEDPARLIPEIADARRVWLVEVNPTAPPSLVPALEAVRPKALDRTFPRIRVARFD
jgi:hypothetical protein